MLSKVVKKQRNEKGEVLIIDIKKNPLLILESIQQFIEHRIQQLDLKNLSVYLSDHKHQVGLREYSTIIKLARNVVTYTLNQKEAEGGDNFWGYESLESVCSEQRNKIVGQ